MKLIPLPSETRINTGFTHKVIIDYTDLTAAAGASDTTVTLPIIPQDVSTAQTETNPIGLAVQRCAMNLITTFDASDAALNSVLVEVGDGGDTDRFLDQTELSADGTYITFKHSKVTTFPHAYTAADTIDAKFTVAGGASPLVDELTSGKVEVYLAIVDLNALETVA